MINYETNYAYEIENEFERVDLPQSFGDIQDGCGCYLKLSIADKPEIKRMDERFDQPVQAVFEECYLLRVQLDDLMSSQDYFVLIGLVDGCYQSYPNIKKVNLDKSLLQDDLGKTFVFDQLMHDNPDELVIEICSTLFELGLSQEAGTPALKF